MSNQSQDLTHFGFKTVKAQDKEKLVAQVFSSVASKYDLMNDVLSFGLHRLWKKETLNYMNIKPGQVVLDLAGGTGDFTAKISPLVGDQGLVVLADYNHAMLQQGQQRLFNQGIANNVKFVQANAECLPFADNSFDSLIISFGLRNVTDKFQALTEMYRVLKPGGRALILEFSKPQNDLISSLYNLYSFQIIPKLGELIAQDSASYLYLAESINLHPDQETMAQMMRDAAFELVEYKNFNSGIVALHRGFKL